MATSADVARLAGVSRATVSRTLSGTANVDKATRARVEAAIASLGYEPDYAARSLVRQRSNVIALSLFDQEGGAVSGLAGSDRYFYMPVLREVERNLAANEYDLLLMSHSSSTSGEAYLRSLRARKAAGAIIIGGGEAEMRSRALVESQIPTVFIDSSNMGSRATSVKSNHSDGMRTMTEHMLRLGHRRIALIRAPTTTTSGHDRLLGMRDALASAGVREDQDLIWDSDWTINGAYQTTRALVESGTDFTAILAESDMMAIGVLRALHGANISVPDEVSVGGFDDIDLAEFSNPPLTTVRQDANGLGEAVTDALLKLLRGENPPRPIVLPVQLVVRASTAPPRDVDAAKPAGRD